MFSESDFVFMREAIELAKKINVRHLIIGSSSSVYGANTKFPFKEIASNPIAPLLN